jgi:hypothetical protein
MNKKKTTFVWILLVLIGLSVISSLISIPQFINLLQLISPLSASILIALSAIQILILINYFFKLFNITPDVIKWTHITFSAFIILNIISMITILNTQTPLDKAAQKINSQFGGINCSAPGSSCSGNFESMMNIGNDMVIFGKVLPTVFQIIITLSMWGGITMHLKRAKKDNLMDFS